MVNLRGSENDKFSPESQIKELMKDSHFQDSIRNLETRICSTFTLILRNFLRNYKADNSSELVESMMPFCQLSGKMYVKLHYLYNHFGCFKESRRLKLRTVGIIQPLLRNYGRKIPGTLEYAYDGMLLLVYSTCPLMIHCKKSLKCRFL